MDRSDRTTSQSTETPPVLPVHSEGCTIEDYKLIARVGEGTFGEVWKAERNGFPVALKILKASMNSEETQRELKSLATLKRLTHKFLLHTENFWSDGDRLFIEMELADGGTLKERLKAHQALGKPGIPEDELLKFFTEASKALDYLHGHTPVFLHRDVKPANILVVRGSAKIGDFGLLRQVSGDNSSTKTQGGTPVYMAPESITEDRFSIHTDLFSFAITYVELRQGRLPFSAKNQFQIFQKICKEPPELGDIFHPEERRVLLRAMAKEPSERFPSCGDFIFELNRVVPWGPAVEIPVLATMPALQEGGTPFFAAQAAAAAAADSKERATLQSPPPRRVPQTMPDVDLPGAPTAEHNDGTLNDPGKRAAKPAAEPAILESATVNRAATDTAPRQALETHRGTAGKSKMVIIIGAAAVLVIAAVVGLSTIGSRTPDNARSNGDTSGKTSRDDGSARNDGESLAAAFLKRADDMRKNGDFKNCLELLAESKLVFSGDDLARRGRIYEQARDGEQDRLVGEVRAELKAASPQVREKLDALKKFRQENGIAADQSPNFKVLPYPSELLARAWPPLLADKVDATEARARFDEVKAYTKQPDTLVLDGPYVEHLAALTALVQAHESAPDSIATLFSVLKGTVNPDCSRNLWLALVPLETTRAAFRFADLENLPGAPNMPVAKNARSQFIATVLDRLVQEGNYQWFPSKDEAAKCRALLSDFQGPEAAVLALKVECLVRQGADPQEIKAIVLPAKADWYVSYANALVLNANQKPVDAAAMLVSGLKGNPKVRKERVPEAMRLLRSAVATLQPRAPAVRQFATAKDAATALEWLALMLDLDQKQAHITVDDLINLACAAVKADSAAADDLLQKAANLLDQRTAADQAAGYRGIAQACLDDISAADSVLAKGTAAMSEQALKKSERALGFALRARKANLLKEAAELNAAAVALKANALFVRTAGDKGKAKFLVFADAIDKAKKQDQAGAFVLPVAVAALESAELFSKDDLQTAIVDGTAALALEVPGGTWWETMRHRGLVRLGDARFVLLVKKANAQEKIDLTEECGPILELYQKAKTPAGKYVEKYPGELSFKIGAAQFYMRKFKDAQQELTEARTKISAIPRPYPAEVRAEIERALFDIDNWLKELKALNNDK